MRAPSRSARSPPEFFIHAAISPDLALLKKLTGGKIIKLTLNAPSAAREDVNAADNGTGDAASALLIPSSFED
jgi:hypothetical protein